MPPVFRRKLSHTNGINAAHKRLLTSGLSLSFVLFISACSSTRRLPPGPTQTWATIHVRSRVHATRENQLNGKILLQPARREMSGSLEFLEYLAYLNNRIKADGGETTAADTEARYFLFCDFWSGNPDRVVTTQRIPRYGRTTEERATITTQRGQTVGYVDIPPSKVFLGFETVTKSRTEYSHFVRLDLVDSKTITESNGYPMWTCVGFYAGSQPALDKIVPALEHGFRR